jgi:hypothetical protein
MPESVDADCDGEQGSLSESRLQCSVDERDGFCDDDLSSGVHVSRYSFAANVYEVGDDVNFSVINR